jgi:YidC/Oxa1 family membrane protein insertase
VLYVGSQLLSTVLMSTATDRTQRILFLGLPFVFVPFVIGFPAGLLVYWITTNFWTIVQQTIVRKRLGPMRPPSADGEGPPMSIMDRMLHRGSVAEGAGGGDGVTAPAGRPAAVASGGRGAATTKSRPAAPPPPSPRKKKKRSGRRR